jgi:IS5 family transposase
MRVVEPRQTQLGDLAIADIQFDIKSRDDIPQLLKGLQFIYVNDEVRNAVFTLLENHIQPETSNNNGRPGMDLWNILVMGVLRLDLI